MRCAAIFAAAVLSGCSSGIIPLRPRATDVDTIEQKLALNPCVKTYEHWSRNYYFEAHPLDHRFLKFIQQYNYDVLRFEYYEEDGVGNLRSGRHVYTRNPLHGIYMDGHFRYAAGGYDLRSRLLVVDFCGWADEPQR